MRNIISILFSFHIFLCASIMPCCDFSILNQLPDIYKSFKQINDDSSLNNFIKEEFFSAFITIDVKDNPIGKPHKKGERPAAIKLIRLNHVVYTNKYYMATENKPVKEIKPIITRYTNNYHNIDLKAIFHPPKMIT